MSEQVAILGLGTMGGHAAQRLLGAGASVAGFDPSPAACEAATTSGVRACDTPKDAVRGASVVILSLPTPVDVIAAARGPLSAVTADTTIIDLSTIDPESAQTAAGEVAPTGASYLDAPVLGRPDHCGQWTLVAGGPAHTVEHVRPLLESSVAKKVVHVGEVGTGSVVKLLNNLMFGAINAVTAEVFDICHRSGLDPETFSATVADSGAATVSGLFHHLSAKIPAGDYFPTFSLGLLHKDNHLALELAKNSGSPAFMARCVDQINSLAVQQNWAHQDTGAVHKFYQLLSLPESNLE